MSFKALVSRQQPSRTLDPSLIVSDAQREGLQVELVAPHGTLVAGDENKLKALEKRGYRVKILPDTNLLQIGAYRIDTEGAPPRLPAGFEVPPAEAPHWRHHLVQLAAPPTPEWIQEIERRGVDVVEKVSAYGLFVVGATAEVERLRELPFVTWVGLFHPAYRVHPGLLGLQGRLPSVSVGVQSAGEVDDVRSAIAAAGGTVIRVEEPPHGHHQDYTTLLVEIDAQHLAAIAARPGVRWVELVERMVPDGEREAQILAQNLDAGGVAPVVGYQPWLTGVGLSGTGVTVAIVDTGIDANANNNVSGHLDLRGRQTAFVDYSGGVIVTDTNGHGTHVAGIAVGNAASGQTEAAAPANFFWGQGVAPASSYVAQNAIHPDIAVQPAYSTMTQDAATNGAQVMNNSWGGSASAPGYNAAARQLDQLVRDPDQATAALENLVVVFSAGNNGGGVSTLTSPHENKNSIIVGNSLTSRPAAGFPVENIRGISGTSSRGPAVDGRLLPNVVAPGSDVSSAFSETAPAANAIAGTGTPDPGDPANLLNQYQLMGGTSQAAPHVSGAAALITEWWRARTGGKNPSAALVKALLINGAEDLGGGDNWRCTNRIQTDKNAWVLESGSIYRRPWSFAPGAVVAANQLLTQVAALANLTAAGQWFHDNAASMLYVWTPTGYNPGAAGVSFVHARDAAPLANIPNNDQGWGRVCLENMFLQAPASNRGPRLFSDQRHAFTAAGQQHVVRVAPVDTARPMRITLVWTDAPGAVNSSPALVNDLDLEVTQVAPANVYRGNNFSNGFSVTGGAFDTLNNVECVYIQNPAAGVYEIAVIASSIVANARPPFDNTPWQDFALIIENAEMAAASPVSVVPVIDRSGSMISYGYVDVTRLSSRAFVDLMSVDDQMGVVSFGNEGVVEYPAGPGAALQTIVGQATRDAAKAEIDDIQFGGCTYMGDGILRARDLLAPAAGARAMVLLSDGYDNKGCDVANPAKPSAIEAVGMLPAAMPIYTCAMGPASDQALLEQIATATGGRYYYMPTIDDLIEIYNYIRGQITSTGIIINDSATASSSRLGGFVDSGTSEVTFSVAWGDPQLRPVLGDARKANEVSVRLRDPRGRLLHPHTSGVRRIVGPSHVIFKIAEPLAGQWYVEVSTLADTHVRYTVGGFVRSPIRLVTTLRPRRIVVGAPIVVSAQVFDGRSAIGTPRTQVRWTRPTLDLDGLKVKYKDQLAAIQPRRGADPLPPEIDRIMTLRAQMMKTQAKDIFSHTSEITTLKALVDSDLALRDMGLTSPLLSRPLATNALKGLVTGRFSKTRQRGSYNVVVSATGVSPLTNSRYVRKELVSILVR